MVDDGINLLSLRRCLCLEGHCQGLEYGLLGRVLRGGLPGMKRYLSLFQCNLPPKGTWRARDWKSIWRGDLERGFGERIWREDLGREMLIVVYGCGEGLDF